MTRDFLRELNLDGDVIDKIMAQYGSDVNGLKSQITDLNSQLKDKDNKLVEYNTKYSDYDDLKGIKSKFEALSTKYDKDTKDLQAKLSKTELENIVIDKLYKSKIINPSIVRSSDKFTEIFTNFDGNVDNFKSSVDSAINDLKESDSYLFESKITANQVGMTPAPTPKSTDPVVNAFYQRNPDLRK